MATKRKTTTRKTKVTKAVTSALGIDRGGNELFAQADALLAGMVEADKAVTDARGSVAEYWAPHTKTAKGRALIGEYALPLCRTPKQRDTKNGGADAKPFHTFRMTLNNVERMTSAKGKAVSIMAGDDDGIDEAGNRTVAPPVKERKENTTVDEPTKADAVKAFRSWLGSKRVNIAMLGVMVSELSGADLAAIVADVEKKKREAAQDKANASADKKRPTKPTKPTAKPTDIPATKQSKVAERIAAMQAELAELLDEVA